MAHTFAGQCLQDPSSGDVDATIVLFQPGG
jgi:hypothetical protein